MAAPRLGCPGRQYHPDAVLHHGVRLDDDVFNYTKADEPVPYAPHRIQNLMAYAISERGLRARETMERWKRV